MLFDRSMAAGTAHYNWGRTLVYGAAVWLVFAAVAPAAACNYGKYGLEPGDGSQTDVDGLLGGRYVINKDFKSADWERQAKADAAKATDIPGKLDYAWALHMAGENEAAVPVYAGILKTNPDHYETLCSYATVLHSMRRYEPARELLEKAVKLKPGFRSRAEEFHLDMINYEEKSRGNFAYAKENLFVPALTSLWENRKGVEENLSTVEFPEGYTSDGMAELVRQFPHNGEGWLALGMLLEHEEDFALAAKAYDRALEKGTAHGEELRTYMATFREFGRSQDSGRLVGRRIVQLGIILGVMAVLLFLFRIASRVIADITGHRAMKENEKRRQRRTKGPDSPL